ncbi:hypothetical protein [Megalodesulfovibrio gigas]|uniref:Uncharacterized protein n=1 Tax=Megalodesulfovibrio gigas (strain ATCC 19364 / DSM 1382 / NCIMB 9332 / VKM B-1759) TaxID=1121448 RepID=T2GCX5_MEGG1|nr:hypothetical protein [Megalodesulfovibrio gigas]AGW14138.1 hypothetical protein DGI_2387 [Megalodesulfovibrio gigas DSM 1382 = ATCC 19364]
MENTAPTAQQSATSLIFSGISFDGLAAYTPAGPEGVTVTTIPARSPAAVQAEDAAALKGFIL